MAGRETIGQGTLGQISGGPGGDSATGGRRGSGSQHRSIGEVLSLLQEDFPDITISKIRFLESKGLIDPERTPSGYRKFNDDDVAALEWILRQQRDHFLPLRVIRERIERGDHLVPEAELDALVGDAGAASADAGVDEAPSPVAGTHTGSPAAAGVEASEPPTIDLRSAMASPLSGEATAVTMTAEELMAASGLTGRELTELETYGLLSARSMGPTTYYDGEALLVARAAKEFADFGVEPRHLRMFRTAAEREASVFEQAVMPLAQQRRPDSRQETRAALERLAVLGERLRGAMMRAALDEHLG